MLVLAEAGSLDIEEDELFFFMWCFIGLALVELCAIESFDMLEPFFIESLDIEPWELDMAPDDIEPDVLPLGGVDWGVDCWAMAMPVAVRPQSISERQIFVRMFFTLDGNSERRMDGKDALARPRIVVLR